MTITLTLCYGNRHGTQEPEMGRASLPGLTLGLASGLETFRVCLILVKLMKPSVPKGLHFE